MSSKISALSAAAALDGTEQIPAVQAAGNVALTPNQIATLFGTYQAYTPVFTGFSVDPNMPARYMRIGKMCHVIVGNAGSGTSNATTFTMTLPFAAANTYTQIGLLSSVTDNTTLQSAPGRISLAANSNVATLFKTVAAGAWTGSGSKGATMSLLYETV